jgi:hypothetical protein
VIKRSIDLKAIKGPAVKPSTTPDALTVKQRLALTLKQRIEYEHLKLIERLEDHLEIVRRERDGHKNDCAQVAVKLEEKTTSFHAKEIEYEKLRVTRRGDRCKDAICAVMSVVGGGLISSFPKGTGWFAFGWAILSIAALMQLIRAGLNVP